MDPKSGLSGPEPDSPRLLRLPSETLREILTYMEDEDLFNLCLVSRAVHELAASQLYRRLRHIFFVPTAQEGDITIDFLAGALEVLTTSDYNYASYLKEIYLDISPNDDGGDIPLQERIAQQFKYDHHCGKFFNNVLLSAIKGTSILETFRWNVRVELNSSIFAALGKMASLKNVHIRMHSGPSTHSLPPPTTAPPAPHPVPTQPIQYNGIHHHTLPPFSSAVLATPRHTSFKPTSLLDPHRDSGRTFSRLSNVRSLSVLDMDNLESIPEISKCIEQSSSTLKVLKLSFSESLALKSRKKDDGVGDASETSSVDDEQFEAGEPAPQAGAAPAFTSTNSHEASVRKEKIAQENALIRIFGLEKERATQKKLSQAIEASLAAADKELEEAAKLESKEKLDRAFVEELRTIVQVLNRNRASYLNEQKDLKIVETLEKAALKYLDGRENMESDGNKPKANEPETTPAANHVTPPTDNANGTASNSGDQQAEATNGDSAVQTPESGTNTAETDTPPTDDSDSQVADTTNQDPIEERVQEVVDIEHPDELSEGEDQEFTDQANGIAETKVVKPIKPIAQSGADKLKEGEEPNNLDADPLSKVPEPVDYTETSKGTNTLSAKSIQEYIREHHGIALESLSINLIPLKTAVICRAVNIWELKHISLLNVGPQRGFWAMLTTLHGVRPLQLSSVHTDNVTPTFLELMNKLERLEEFFIVERNKRSRVEPLAPPTTVVIEDIRKQVLEKHMPHLKRLVIRNDNNTTWSLDFESTFLLTKLGKKLQELVLNLESDHFHVLMRGIRNLHALQVLHVIYSHTNYCPGILEQISACVVDSVCHYEHLKLEYVAVSYGGNGPVDTEVTRISRTPNGLAALKQKDTVEDAEQSTEDPMLLSPDQHVGEKYTTTSSIRENFQSTGGFKVWETEFWNLRL